MLINVALVEKQAKSSLKWQKENDKNTCDVCLPFNVIIFVVEKDTQDLIDYECFLMREKQRRSQ